MPDRWLPLTGCDNARDLGGLPVTDGGLTRSRVLLRSDTLQELTEADARLLVDGYGLRTVLDLRTRIEAEKEGRGRLAEEEVDYYNLPFIPDAVFEPGDRHELIVQQRRARDRIEHYVDYLRDAPDSCATALRLMAGADTTPAIFHCAAGKDRTGVLAALALEIVGVPREAVVADYELTNERISLIGARLRRLPTYARDTAKRPDAELMPAAETMYGFLAAVDERWGGAAGFARSAGLTDVELAGLRDRLVEH
jgi:protein tyrosine/serine phosphatase